MMRDYVTIKMRTMNFIERRPIEGYEGLYEVDNMGNIYTLPKNSRPERILVFSPDSFGYLRVGLCKNNKVKTFKAHRIVALTFIPNLENLPQVNHKNGIKTDNRVENLEWASAKSNINHAWKIGLSKALNGDSNGNSKISDNERDAIVRDYALTDMTQDQIGKKYGVTQSNVAQIVKAYLKRHFGLIEAGLAIDKTKEVSA
jgi:hypothetical protein